MVCERWPLDGLLIRNDEVAEPDAIEETPEVETEESLEPDRSED